MKRRTGGLLFLVQALLLVLLICLVMTAHAEDGAVHEWDGGVVTTPATCTSDGVRTYTCTRPGCGATYTESIPAKGHSPETLPAKLPAKPPGKGVPYAEKSWRARILFRRQAMTGVPGRKARKPPAKRGGRITASAPNAA